MNKNHFALQLEKNSIVDEGDGLITVRGGLTLTDGSRQHDGTSYDIKTFDIGDYDGRLFADHGGEWRSYTIDTIIGRLIGVTKNSKRVFASGIKYFLSNPLGLLAYNGAAQGFLTDFSVATMGDEPEDGVYKNHSLFETSQVGIGNNKNAKLNEIVANSLQQAKDNGLDTSELEKAFHVKKVDKPINSKGNEDMKVITIKNDRDFAVKVDYKNAAGEDVETEVPAGGGLDVSEDQKEAIENQFKEAKAPEKEDDKANLSAMVDKIVSERVKPMEDKLKTYEEAFDKSAKEPEFTLNSASAPIGESVKNALAALDYRELHQQQIEFARRMLVNNSSDAAKKLESINAYNLDRLKETEGKDGRPLVRNTMTLADMGNFVISPELLTEIQGCRTSYAPVVDNTEWRETLSTHMAWLERSGDIDMQEVDFCEDSDGSVGSDGNLKPVSEYGANLRTAALSEVAAVTPVCNAATKFLAVDVLGDVAAGYRNDYDRKRAQLFIARLEQAVDASGNAVAYDASTPEEALISWLNTFGEISTCTPIGTYILSDKSLIELRRQLIYAGGSDVYNQVFFRGENGVPTIDGKPYIVVPSDLLPTLGTNETKTFVVSGESITINHAVFYLDLANFTGRTSGGLQYDLATQASYEDGQGTVKSAFQRNEIVLRGSFFRGGAIKDREQVSGLLAPATS